MKSSFHIKYKKQQVSSGCAIACVAMIADVSYKEARKAVLGTSRGGHYASFDQCIKGLKKLGILGKRSNSYNKNTPAILMFSWSYAPDVHHCVVYDPAFGGRFIDPAGSHDGSRFYLQRWRRSGKETLVIVGKTQ